MLSILTGGGIELSLLAYELMSGNIIGLEDWPGIGGKFVIPAPPIMPGNGEVPGGAGIVDRYELSPTPWFLFLYC